MKPLTDTVCHLANINTEVLVSYQERFDGNKPQLKKQFFEVAYSPRLKHFLIMITNFWSKHKRNYQEEDPSVLYELRSFQVLVKDFSIYEIPQEDQDEIFQSSDINIVSMKKKK